MAGRGIASNYCSRQLAMGLRSRGDFQVQGEVVKDTKGNDGEPENTGLSGAALRALLALCTDRISRHRTMCNVHCTTRNTCGKMVSLAASLVVGTNCQPHVKTFITCALCSAQTDSFIIRHQAIGLEVRYVPSDIQWYPQHLPQHSIGRRAERCPTSDRSI